MNTFGDIAVRASGAAFGLETQREVAAEAGGTIHIEDAALLFRGDYARAGSDLVISGEGHRLVVHDYFLLDNRPRLVAPNGASLDASVIAGLVKAATGDVTAQAGEAPASDASAAIGRVQKVTGSATVVRNGVTVALHVGDLVYKGDAVQTDAASSLSVSFLDGTLFNLSASARMLLSDLVYQASGTGNSALFNLVQGSITFVAGQVAKTGDMKVGTPVATMGIRGTAVHVTIEADNGTTTFSVMTEPDGHTGRFDVYDRTNPGKLLFTVSDPGLVAVVRPDGPYQVTFEQLPKPPVDVQTEAAIVQLLFRTIAESPRLPVFQGPSTGGGTGSSTSPNLVLPQPDVQTPTVPNGPNVQPGGQHQQQGTPGGGTGTPNRPDDRLDTQTPVAPHTDDPAPQLVLQPQTVTVAQDAALVASAASQGVLGAAAAATVRVVAAHAGAEGSGTDIPVSGDTLVLHGRYGTLVLGRDGTYVYLADHAAALAAGQHGTDVFAYRAEGAGGTSAGATLTIDVVGINDAPVVSGPAHLTDGPGARTISAAELLANASDVDGDTLAVADLRIVQGSGTLVALDGGSYRYVPASSHGSAEPVILAYTISDGHGGSVAQTAQFTTPVSNVAPAVSGAVALADSPEDTSRVVTAAELLAGASDADGDTLSVSGLHVAGGGGTLTNLGGGRYRYDPLHDANGPVVLGYTISDGYGGSVAQTAVFTVTPVNDTPTVSGSVTFADSAEDTPRTITLAQLLAGASDVDGDALSVSGLHVVSGGGTITANGDGTYRYTPVQDANGPVVLGYTIEDGHGGSVAQSAGFTITPVNDAPTVAGQVTLSDSAEDTSRIVTAAELLAGASDADGDTLSVSGLHVASGGGTLTDLGGGRYRYDPAHDANGPVVLGYTINDGYGGSVAQTAGFTVTPVHDAPTVSSAVTLSDSAEDTPRTITLVQLLAGASDVDGDALSVSGLHVVSGGGTVSISSLGGYRYTPAHDANGPVVLGYTIQDGHGGSVAQTAGFTVTPVNDAPSVAGAVTLSDSAEDTPRTVSVAQLLAGASDVDGDALSVSGLHVFSGGGTIVDVGEGTYRYTPAQDADGPVVLGYTIQDGHGGSVSQSAGFTVTPVNDAPVLTLGSGLATYTEDDPALPVASDITLSDVDSRTMSGAAVRIGAGFHAGQDVLGISLPPNSSISASYDAQTGVLALTGVATLAAYLSALASVTYANTSEAPSSDTRTLGFQVTDDAGAASVIVTREVAVVPVNDAPTPHDDNAFVYAGSSVTLDVLANDTDPDGDVLSVASVGTPGHGSVTLNSDGTLTYTPGDGYAGPDTFTYTVKDAGGLTAQAIVDIVVGYSAHKTVGTDVFLQGAYMEIGVSGSGSLGSASNAPTGFHPQGSSAISFVIDTNGWGSGTTPTSNDVTLPGTPEDAIVIGYDGKSFANSERTSVVQFAAKTVDTSSAGHLQTTTTGLTAANGLQVTQVIDLDPNASYFSTTVTLTNLSATDMHDARFMRSFDPDQDAIFYGDYSTDNDVLANPTGGGGAAIVQALGTHSGTSVNLVSFESGARGSAAAFTNHDAYAAGVYDSPVDPNGKHADVGIAMDMDFGDLAPGQSVTRTFYTTLNTQSGANDLIVGTAGNDTIDGKGGNDIIIGLGGDDILTGGSGSDTFVFIPSGNDGRTHAALNSPVITDFTPGADVLQFDHTIFATSQQALSHATQAGSDVQIAWDTGDGSTHTVLTLRNVLLADLHLRDVHIS